MKDLRSLRYVLMASLFAYAATATGCRKTCPGGDEQVVPDSLDISGAAAYRSDTTGELQIDLAAVTEPHYAEPIYDGNQLDLEWEAQGMTFALTLAGPLAVGTTALEDLGAQLCACDPGFLQGPPDAPECFRNGQVTPARCEAVLGEATVREISRECIGSGAMEDCAERIDMDIVVPESEDARFSGEVMIRWFEAIESRSCYDGPSI
ncbi:MAG: hypothetical protein JNK04_16655, partial [Myxococcales bacterium]|nr:hypothetical protein [Myxococcales bacterium]